jgi:hypothetical protein
MTDNQVFHFVYWLQEQHNLRGITEKETVLEKMEKIEELKAEFFSKYPSGMLSGWRRDTLKTMENYLKY